MRVTLDMSAFQQRLDRIGAAMRDLTPVWPAIHEIALRFFQVRFASEGSYPAGEQWPC